ncbi:unnamed protein product [Cuscuta campestris]|uniref:CCHC-type domain-containing protein n=1 Tax=Cuscuta campestris TaxID=132261 RepID=A0A484KX77_9ASTE|nr:unnamed protein product [Cuscuta campestris]
MRIYIQSTNFLLWRIIKKGKEVPMKKDGENIVPKTEDEYDAPDIKKIENNTKAINILYCAVNPDDYRKISCCSTAKKMWYKLEITYEGEQKKKGIALNASTSQEPTMEESSDEDNEFGLVIKKFHKFIQTEYERKNKKQGGPPKCYGCGEIGHIKPKCPNAKNEKEKKPFKKLRAYISWGGDSGDESSYGEENESANLCLMAHEEPPEEPYGLSLNVLLLDSLLSFNFAERVVVFATRREVRLPCAYYSVPVQEPLGSNGFFIRWALCLSLEDKRKLSMNAKAINILHCSLGPDEFARVCSCKTAKEVWDLLQATHERETSTKQTMLPPGNSEYESFKKGSSCETIEDMNKRFNEIVNKLTSKDSSSEESSESSDDSSDSSTSEESNVEEDEEKAMRMKYTDFLKWKKYVKRKEIFSKPKKERHKTSEESPHVVFAESDTRLVRKVSYDDLVDSLENIYLNDNDKGNNSKETQDEEEEPPMDEEQQQEEEMPMPMAWRISKDHPLDKDEDRALISNVNKVDIYLSEENMLILTELRWDGKDLSLYVGEGGARFNETALLEEVGIWNFTPTPLKPRPTITSMNSVFRFIFYVLTWILKPRKYNHSSLSQEDTKTLHAMIHNANINWCKFVMTHMFNATSDDQPLPYALLVIAILDEYHIKTDVGPKRKGTKHWEIDESSFHSGNGETPFSPPCPRRQPREASSSSPSLSEQMAALTATLSQIDTNVAQIAESVNTLSHELHGYFDFVNYPYAQMVPYVPPPNFGNEGQPSGVNDVEDEEEEEEENEENEDEEEETEEETEEEDEEDEDEEDVDKDKLLDDSSEEF